jgi:hypothetical protein
VQEALVAEEQVKQERELEPLELPTPEVEVAAAG